MEDSPVTMIEEEVKKTAKEKSSTKIRTKLKLAEERRVKSLGERYKSLLADKHSIKLALSGKNLANKKIRFSNSDDSGEEAKLEKKDLLLEGSSDESEEELEQRFRNNKPDDIIKLQSRFATDPRFKLDERFHEDKNETGKVTEEDSDEKVQGNVLKSLFGNDLPRKHKEKQVVGPSVIRFDPLKHSAVEEKSLKKRKKQDVTEPQVEENKVEEPVKEEREPILQSKFYEVKSDLKDIIKGNESKGFSLLETFGPVEEKTTKKSKRESKKEIMRDIKIKPKGVLNPFKYDSSDSEYEESAQSDVFSQLEVRISENEPKKKRESFFFPQDDPRFKEGLEFTSNCNNNAGKQFSTKRAEIKSYAKVKAHRYALKSSKMAKLGAAKRKAFPARKRNK